MKILVIVFIAVMILFMLMGNMTINGITRRDFPCRLASAVVFGALADIFIGLPILGLISLFS